MLFRSATILINHAPRSCLPRLNTHPSNFVRSRSRIAATDLQAFLPFLSSWKQPQLNASHSLALTTRGFGSGTSSSESGGGGSAVSSEEKAEWKREEALVRQHQEEKAIAAVERQRLHQQARQAMAPFREVGDTTQGSATVMASMLRPTSTSLPRLFAGLTISIAGVAGLHWCLHPTDPFCVLSIAGGSFLYVLVVGTSHSAVWYAIAAPLAMLALLVFPTWPSYVNSLDGDKEEVPARFRRSNRERF
eukprot:TRINITY_DN55515_c0_g1_i1.p1 TRINITY_DN55515_c0_g1~~TRINITY_DN55515_c0_g1_i1.p1  ORF type:complete len:248 (-),score=35.24 TRINITY_DN55515_c0_g1_i1:185-928(-)